MTSTRRPPQSVRRGTHSEPASPTHVSELADHSQLYAVPTRASGMSSIDTKGDSSCRQQERRRTTRYQIVVSVHCRWRESDGTVRRITGWTKDISVHGVSIVADSTPPQASSIEVTVSFPSGASRPATTVQMRGKGTVVRVEPGSFAVAAVFHVGRANYSRIASCPPIADQL
jgi:hypothetical protein